MNSDEIKRRSQPLFKNYAANKDLRVRDRLAQLNDGLAMKVAKRYESSCSESLDDLLQLARIGLLKAIERFSTEKGVAFSSFAMPYIQGEIRHYLRDNRSIKIPRQWQESRDKAQKLAIALSQQRGTAVDISEAAIEGLGIPPEKWQQIEKACATRHIMLSIDEDDEDAVQIGFEDTSVEDADESERLRVGVAAQLNQLPQQDAAILIEHFWGSLPPQLIARRHGLTKREVQGRISAVLSEMRGAIAL